MTIKDDSNQKRPNMPLTLEEHFEWLSEWNPSVKNLNSLWLLLRKDLEDRLIETRGVYVHFSLHDASHSRSVIRAIERFLGDDRISKLSATDTFMLLSCAYAHDYGMAMTFNQVNEVLAEPNFEEFLLKMENSSEALRDEEIRAVRNLLSYVRNNSTSPDLSVQYFSIIVAIQMYLRPAHWQGVGKVWSDFQGLLEGRLNGRFIQGKEGIINICECHGKSFDSILEMGIRADGIVGDEFHPRFIAAMLRLGDLLDLDNGRFPRWFVSEIERDQNCIPKLSELHYRKHEAISHLLITPKRIEISATCLEKDNGYEVAELVSEWISWLQEECNNLIQHWSAISQPDFGRPPTISKVEILLDGKPYTSENYMLQMRMSQNRMMKLLEGTNLYRDKYVGIRELVQNAVDASLLQLWYDVMHNRYYDIGVTKYGYQSESQEAIQPFSKKDRRREILMTEWSPETYKKIFNNYEITIELIQHLVEQKVYVIVKDKGTGISLEDVKYMADIGTSKEQNARLTQIMRGMPRWLKPAGLFGVGLQSAFQLTDEIEFYTRQPNEPERVIIFHSYGKNRGKIEIREVVSDSEDVFYDNAVPGTNVKISIDPKKLLADADSDNKSHFIFYDIEFDSDDILHALYAELAQVIEMKIREYPTDYFNINFVTMQICPNNIIKKNKPKCLRHSYFSPDQANKKDKAKMNIESNSIIPILKAERTPEKNAFYCSESEARFIEETTRRIHRLSIRSCKIRNGEVRLPDPVRNLYRFQYKFSPVKDAETVYPLPIRQIRGVHAGFFYWDINIMDDNPSKYLNINRDQLRDGAITEKELTVLQEKILSLWCDKLINRFKTSEAERIAREERARSKYKKEGTEDKVVIEPKKNIFQYQPQTLLSLAILFYQNIPEPKFREFIDPYNDFLMSLDLKLESEEIKINDLWKEDTKFRTAIPYPEGWNAEINNRIDALNEISLQCDTIQRLPHRLIHISKIALTSCGTSSELCYYYSLGHVIGLESAIEMDEAARFYDYCKMIDANASNPKRMDLDSLVRKVLKPNAQFSNLIISEYPKNFHRGHNFSSPIDHCIRRYILSPFDRQMTRLLYTGMTNSDNTTAIIDKMIPRITSYAATCEQLRKCIQYTCSKRRKEAELFSISLPEKLERIINDEYLSLIKDCCTLLITHRELVKMQFKSTK